MIHPHDPDEPPMAAKYAAFNRYRPRTEVSTTQYASDWDEPDATIRPATTDPAEVAPVHTGGNAEDCPACDGRSDLPYPWICPGKDLTASGREPAVRASEAPRGEGSPTPDVGAMRGMEGGSAAESEPRVHYEVEMYNDGWSIPIYRTDSVDDARAHEEPAVTSASTRIVRVTREVIQ